MVACCAWFGSIHTCPGKREGGAEIGVEGDVLERYVKMTLRGRKGSCRPVICHTEEGIRVHRKRGKGVRSGFQKGPSLVFQGLKGKEGRNNSRLPKFC